MEDGDDRRGLREWKRFQQDGIDDAENGRVRPDAESEDEQRGEREAWGFAEGAEGVQELAHLFHSRARAGPVKSCGKAADLGLGGRRRVRVCDGCVRFEAGYANGTTAACTGLLPTDRIVNSAAEGLSTLRTMLGSMLMVGMRISAMAPAAASSTRAYWLSGVIII